MHQFAAEAVVNVGCVDLISTTFIYVLISNFLFFINIDSTDPTISINSLSFSVLIGRRFKCKPTTYDVFNLNR